MLCVKGSLLTIEAAAHRRAVLLRWSLRQACCWVQQACAVVVAALQRLSRPRLRALLQWHQATGPDAEHYFAREAGLHSSS